jgi:hypothetical protein
MTVRLHVLVHAATIFLQGTDPKARAMGYSHSYLDPKTAEIKSLAVFPTDDEIEGAAGEAWAEAIALFLEFKILTLLTHHPLPVPTPAILLVPLQTRMSHLTKTISR